MTEFVAQRVQQLRSERRWSAQQLADECARAGFDTLSRGTIAKIESNVRKSITVEEVHALAKAFGVPPSDLLPPTPTPTDVEPTVERLADPPHGTELEGLRAALTRLDTLPLAVMMSHAAGPAVPLPQRDEVHNAWDAFRYLSEFNAGPDGVPPSVLFLERLAGELGGEEGAVLRDWVEDQARQLGIGRALERHRRPRVPRREEPLLHLTIMVEPDALDPDRCVLSSWRQDDPLIWPPTRGEVREVWLEELEYRVDEIILDAEAAWSDQAISAAVEFLLPRSLLNLPVQRWRKEHGSGEPRPLSFDYHISVRSLERMRTKHWHRAWHVRWDSMLERPSVDRLHFSGFAESREHPIDVVLSDPRWVGLVMAKPPPPRPGPGAEPDELVSALRSGLPVICWHPYAEPEQLRDVLDWLLDGVNGIMDLHARRKMASSLPLNSFDDLMMRDLVVLWDDPKQVIILDQEGIEPPRPA